MKQKAIETKIPFVWFPCGRKNRKTIPLLFQQLTYRNRSSARPINHNIELIIPSSQRKQNNSFCYGIDSFRVIYHLGTNGNCNLKNLL